MSRKTRITDPRTNRGGRRRLTRNEKVGVAGVATLLAVAAVGVVAGLIVDRLLDFDDALAAMDVFVLPSLQQGLGTIMSARHLVLLATGRHKAEAVHQLVEGPVSAMWPATIMQHHPHATVLVDDAAAGRLQLADYFRQTYAAKPAWQGI